MLFNCSIGALAAVIAASIALFALRVSGGSTIPFSATDMTVAIVCIAAYSVAQVAMIVATMVYRSSNQFAYAMTFAGTLLLVEGIILIIAASCGLGIGTGAAGILLVRIFGSIVFFWELKRREPWISFGFSSATIPEIRRLIRPSLGALSLTFASALALQGAVLALGAASGAAAVAAFSSARTLTRIPLQLSGLVLRPTMPELTRAYVAGDHALTARLTRLNVLIAICSTIPFVVLFAFAGPHLVSLLSRDHFTTSWQTITLLSLAGAANSTWTAVASPWIATNRYGHFSTWYIVLSIATVLAPFVPAGDRALNAAAAYLASESITGLIAMHSTRRRYE